MNRFVLFHPFPGSDHRPPPPPAHAPSALIPPPPNHRFPDVKETFRRSIQTFIRHVESTIPEEYLITSLLHTFHFQKRRMYDVLSVFNVIGACEKISIDVIRWVGLSKIPFTLRRLQLEANADSAALSLDTIIGSCDLVSISSLTVRFLLCFLTLRMNTLDIRKVSRYLSRKTGRRKSTLCKLYQIAHILEAAEVIFRSEISGQVTIAERFFVPVEISSPAGSQHTRNLYSIEAILNRVNPVEERVILKRRQEFFTELAKIVSENDLPPPA